jgi:hypothetical protein
MNDNLEGEGEPKPQEEKSVKEESTSTQENPYLAQTAPPVSNPYLKPS